MAFATRSKNPPKPVVHGSPCSIGALLQQLTKAEAAALNEMLYATWPGSTKWRWSQSDLHEACRAEGHDVGLQSVNRHRAGKCRCERAS